MNDQIRAHEWAKALLAKPFVLLDTETTGFGFGAEILQISVIDHLGSELLNTYVKPDKVIDENGTACCGNGRDFPGNHITNEMVRDAPTWPELHPILHMLLADQVWVAYNAEFDWGMIKRIPGMRNGLVFKIPPDLDTG